MSSDCTDVGTWSTGSSAARDAAALSVLLLGEPEELSALLQRIGLAVRRPGVTVATAGLADACARALTSKQHVVLMSIDRAPSTALATIRALTTRLPSTMLVALSTTCGTDVALQAMRAGASEVLHDPLDEAGFAAVLAKLAAIRGLADTRRSRGEIWTVLAPKEGIGATTLVANLGLEMRQVHDRDVVLVDFDFRNGDLALVLNVDPVPSAADLAGNFHDLDPVLLHGSLVRHASGLSLLPATGHLRETRSLSATEAAEILDLLRATYDLTIVDAPPPHADAIIAAVERSQRVLLPTEGTVPSLRAAWRTLEGLAARNVRPPQVELVVTKHTGGRGDLTLDEIHRTLGLPVQHTLPLDAENAGLAINGGLSLAEAAPDSDLRRAIARLAASVTMDTRLNAPRRKGLLGLLFDR